MSGVRATDEGRQAAAELNGPRSSFRPGNCDYSQAPSQRVLTYFWWDDGHPCARKGCHTDKRRRRLRSLARGTYRGSFWFSRRGDGQRSG